MQFDPYKPVPVVSLNVCQIYALKIHDTIHLHLQRQESHEKNMSYAVDQKNLQQNKLEMSQTTNCTTKHNSQK